MFSSLVKKVTPTKTNVAKIFFVMFVCFLVFGINQKTSFAQIEGMTATQTQKPAVSGPYTQYGSSGGFSRTDNTTANLWYSPSQYVASEYSVGTYNSSDSSFSSDKRIIALMPKGQDPTDPKTSISELYSIDSNGNATRINTYDNNDPAHPIHIDLNNGTANVGTLNGILSVEKNNSLKNAGLDPYGPEANKAKDQAAKTSNSTLASATQASQSSTPPEISCGWGDITCMISKTVYYLTIVPASGLVWMAGWLFDKTFEITVVNLSSTLGKSSNSGFYPVIVNVWSIFRDLINMTFIFILLYAAIITILKADTSGMKKTVGAVIVAAVLINFSLFFTEVIIDVSNNFAVAIHNNIIQKPGDSISAGFMDKLQLQTLMGAATPTDKSSGLGRMMIICIFGSVFLLILAVVFFIVAILFVVRFVTFIILLMMSPVGIGGAVVPKLQETLGKDFWHDLLDQCFFAPVFMLFLWAIIRVLDAATSIGKENMKGFTLSNALGNGGTGKVDGTIGYWLLTFGVIIYLIIKALEISKSMSSSGAKGIQEGLLKYSGADALQSFSKRLPSIAARNIVGRTAAGITDTRFARNLALNNALGRAAYKGLKKTSEFGFGDGKGFSQRELEDQKQKKKFADELLKPTSREQLEKNKQEQLVNEQKERERNALQKSNALEAEEKLQQHRTEKNNLMEQRAEAAHQLSEREEYKDILTELNNPSLPKKDRDAGEALKKEAEEIAFGDIDKKIDELDSSLEKAFKNANIHIEANDTSTFDGAKEKLEQHKELLDSLDKSGELQNKTIDELKEIAKEAGKNATKEETELKRINATVGMQTKQAQQQYAQTLKTRRLANLYNPSKAAQMASAELRKDANKSDSEKELEKAVKLIKGKMGIKEEEEKTQTPPPTAPKPKN